MADLPVDRSVRVRVPATSANLGPGFDVFGLAWDWTDELTVRVTADSDRATVTGEGADRLPTGPSHLVLRSVTAGLRALGVVARGLELTAHNTIPHGRGLGSSSAAIVAGLTAAWGLARPDVPLDRAWVLQLANEIEGHPDNVAAATYGGLVLAYPDTAGRVQVITPPVHPELAGVVLVPRQKLETRRARGLLPTTVPHADAAFNGGRAALLLHALTVDPGLLLEATVDRLHQGQRAPAMPASAALIAALRQAGCAAVVSGAGPTVLVLGKIDELTGVVDAEGFAATAVRPGPGAALV